MRFSDWVSLWRALEIRNQVGHEIVTAMREAPVLQLLMMAEYRRLVGLS